MTIRPILCTIALAGLCACGSADVNLSFRGDDGQRLIAMNETLAVIGTEEDMDEELRGCVETGLRERLDRVTLIPGEQFQSAMSPWFRKGSVPADGAALQEVLAEQQVATRLRSLGLRYIIGLSGASSDESARWGGCGGGYAGFACLGGMGNREAVRLAATVLDVKAGEAVASASARGTGKTELGMILLVPYLWITPTGKQTCAKFTDRLAALFLGQKFDEAPDPQPGAGG